MQVLDFRCNSEVLYSTPESQDVTTLPNSGECCFCSSAR